MPPYLLPISVIALCAGALILALVVFLRAKRLDMPPCSPPQVPEYDPALAERAGESLSGAIQFTTVSYSAQLEHGGYREFVRLREYLKARYPRVHNAMTREQVGVASLLFTWPSPKPQGDPVLFCAHMDVVPAEGGGWRHPPFGGEIADGHVWGRGTIDCKGVLISLLEAAEKLLAEGFEPTRDIYLAFGHDEEVGGHEGAGEIAGLFIERNLHFSMVLDEGGALSRTAVPIGRPAAHVAVTEKGQMNLRFTAYGEGGHAAEPPAHTPLGRLSEVLCRLEFRPVKPRLTPVVREMLMRLAPELPWRWKIYLGNQWLFKRAILRELCSRSGSNALVRTTIAPTMAQGSQAPNVLGDKAEIILNARILHDEDEAALTQFLHDITADLDVEVEVLRSSEPSHVSSFQTESFEQLSRAIIKVYGETPILPVMTPSGTDARHYERFSDSVYRFMPFILTPEEQHRMHGVDERIPLGTLACAVEVYAELMRG